MPERSEPIPMPDLWFMDNFKAWPVVGVCAGAEVDMTAAKRLVQRMRDDGFPGTYAHLFIRAVALALKRNPDLHFIVHKNRRIYPDTIDLGLTFGDEGFVTSLLQLKDAGNKSLKTLAQEIDHLVSQARTQEPAHFPTLRRWGWVFPGWLRSRVLKHLWSQLSFQRTHSAPFIVSYMNQVDFSIPFVVSGTAQIEAGRVRDRVMVVDGKPEVRPSAMMMCGADHKVWNGGHVQRLLAEISKILRRGELNEEWSK